MDAVQMAYEVMDAVLAVVVIITMATSAIGIISYRRVGVKKLLYVALGLTVFFIKALVMAFLIYTGIIIIPVGLAWFIDIVVIFDAMAAILIYISLLG